MGTSSGSSNPSVSACSRTGPSEIAAWARSCSGSTSLRRTVSNAPNEIVIDRHEVTGELRGEKAVGFRSLRVSENIEKRRGGTFGPVPGWRVLENL